MKDLCTHVDIVVDRLRRRPLFFLSRGLSEQLKEAGWTMVDLKVDVLQ